MNTLRFAVLAALAIGAVGFKLALQGANAPPQAGQYAPDFTLPSQDGTEINLKDFRGKWVVLYFYPKDNTPGCTVEAHNFERDLPKYERLNTIILGVSVDSTGSHKEFCAKQGLTFKLLADTSTSVASQYGSLRNLLVTKIAMRNTFLIDPSGKIAKVWTGVSPSRHSDEVIAALAALHASVK